MLAQLYLDVKGICLGPTLLGFLLPNVTNVLVEKLDIKPIGTFEEAIAAMMAGALRQTTDVLSAGLPTPMVRFFQNASIRPFVWILSCDREEFVVWCVGTLSF